MKVAVLNGSPRGRYSTTLHSVLFLQKMFSQDEFTVVETSSAIRSLEKDLSPLLGALEDADLVLFAYPVYTFIVPSQLHRAIELLKESGVDLSGKFCAQITTSKHFYDVTAHRFIEENATDMGMRYIRGLYADMDDLLKESGRRELCAFWEFVRFRCMAEGKPGSGYGVQGMDEVRNPSLESEYRVALVTDCCGDGRLMDMIGNFIAKCPARVDVVNISEFPFKGGCIGCFNCASDGVCIYRDGYSDFLKERVFGASAIVYAFRLKDHSMGSLFKMYDDRQFCNGHRMMTIGTPVGYLVEGHLSQEHNLETIIEARAEVGRNFLCRTVDSDSPEEDLQRLSDELMFALRHRTVLPAGFYGVGGTRIFRDLIWLMRGLMKADHRFYRKHGVYDDLPHRHIGYMLKVKLLGLMFSNRKLRRKMGNRMNEGMVAPYRKVVEGKVGR